MKEQKTIGILGGMGPYATVYFYKQILDSTPVKKDWDHFRILIDSNVKIPSRTRAVLYNETSPVPDLINSINDLQPFGKGNSEPIFILKDFTIDSIKILKNKHILIFFENDLGQKIKAICFNAIDTIIGDFLEKFNQYQFYFACILTTDKFTSEPLPQLIIKDVMKINLII